MSFMLLKKYAKNHPATFWLIVINSLMFLITIVTGGFSNTNLFALGALLPSSVKTDGEFIRILLSMFLHGSFFHYLTNMIALYFLGTAMERTMGPLRYLLLYFISGIGGGIAIVLFGNLNTLTVGASGALYGIMAGMLYITFTKKTWFTLASVRSIRRMTILNLIITFMFPNISVIGHLAGFVFGFIASAGLIPKYPYFVKFRSEQRQDDGPIGGNDGYIS